MKLTDDQELEMKVLLEGIDVEALFKLSISDYKEIIPFNKYDQ